MGREGLGKVKESREHKSFRRSFDLIGFATIVLTFTFGGLSGYYGGRGEHDLQSFFLILVFLSFAAGFIAGTILYLSVRCPKCDGPVKPSGDSKPRELRRYCPKCRIVWILSRRGCR